MIPYEKTILSNGLKVLVHTDTTTPLLAINILYDVGSRDEDPGKTGFAHLFEHLMFGGSKHIEVYDTHVEKIGGENNAFTSNDLTNYYLSIPVGNVETALWLESDRMFDLAFSEKSFEVQRNVVIEEFRQRYLNQPYGDVWLLLRPLAFEKHPYRWPTIGKEISHIENANMQDVRDFYRKFYNPDNAILTLAGDINPDKAFRLAEKWFGGIENQAAYLRDLPEEPSQTAAREMEVYRNVPFDGIYRAYHMSPRLDDGFYAIDLLSDILSNGTSSRLYRRLVKEKGIFSEINAYITGDIDPGLFLISGKPVDGVSVSEAQQAIDIEIDRIKSEYVTDFELEKVKNKVESITHFSEINVLDKAMNLSYYELIGDASLYNDSLGKYMDVTKEEIKEAALKILDERNCSTLYYLSGHDKINSGD